MASGNVEIHLLIYMKSSVGRTTSVLIQLCCNCKLLLIFRLLTCLNMVSKCQKLSHLSQRVPETPAENEELMKKKKKKRWIFIIRDKQRDRPKAAAGHATTKISKIYLKAVLKLLFISFKVLGNLDNCHVAFHTHEIWYLTL